MSTQYNGLVGNISYGSGVNIASSTNATPIKVTTSANHLLTEGDTIQITGHQTNTAANGIWVVHIVSLTEVTLLTSVGSGVGGATGAVQSLALLPTFAIPADTDDASAASVDVGLEANADRAQWLARRILPATMIASYGSSQVNNDAATTWSSTNQTNGSVTWAREAAADFPFSLDLVPQDVSVEIHFHTSCRVNVAGDVAFSLFAHLHDYGVAGAFASATKVTGSGVIIPAGATPLPLALRGLYVPSLTHGKALSLFVASYGFAVGNTPYTFEGDHFWHAQARRSSL